MHKLKIELNVSRQLTLLLLLTHIAAALILIFLTIPWWVKISLWLLIITSCYYYMQRHAWRRSPQSIVTLANQFDDEWLLFNRKGERLSVVLRGDSFLSNLILVLNFKQKNRRFLIPVVIFADALDKECLRRLKVILQS